uniref:protein-tyrosine-phosphatase n=1 Tax=Electrophorus electricus TaxID=8005 RepID=A0A4W4ERP8_ELEEL
MLQDFTFLPGETCLSLIPCTCSRGTRHTWSRLKVDIGELPEAGAVRHRCFEDINECIDASTEKRKRVLVHCRDGFSLAPTCVIQYLMIKQNMRLIAAYELLRAKLSALLWIGLNCEAVVKKTAHGKCSLAGIPLYLVSHCSTQINIHCFWNNMVHMVPVY